MKKVEVHQYCVQFVEERIDRLNKMINSAQQAANEDTKSSAGDKYETNREMMQAEKDKALMQLSEASKLRKVLDGLNPNSVSESVELGSLVLTNLGVFYIAVAIGEFEISKTKIFGISPVSPIGIALKGVEKSDSIQFNGREVQVSELY